MDQSIDEQYIAPDGFVQKIAACKVNPQKLFNRDNGNINDGETLIMVDDCLIDEVKKDLIGAKYLRMTNSVSFNEMCSFVVELPISEHWRPEVKLTK